jgi:hypothetical protein
MPTITSTNNHNSATSATAFSGLLDLFTSPTVTSTSTSITGLSVQLDRRCRRCGSCISIIGSSRGPHFAALNCADCGVHTGWLPRVSLPFLSDTIDRFGRPNKPIILHGDCSKC